MFTDQDLKKTFPYGALAIIQSEESSFEVLVNTQDWVDEDLDPDFFFVWRTPMHQVALSRHLTQQGDVWVTMNEGGREYALRPRTKDKKVVF